jgi:hypothetical protein
MGVIIRPFSPHPNPLYKKLCPLDGGDRGSTSEPLELRVFIGSRMGARVHTIVVMGEQMYEFTY